MYFTPVKIQHRGTHKDSENAFIVDARGVSLCALLGTAKNRLKVGEQLVRALNFVDRTTSQDTIPTSCVYPRDDQEGFLGKTLVAPIHVRMDEGDTRIVITFNDEPDIVLDWKSDRLNDPWDYCVVECVALIDLVCVRADQIWLGQGDEIERLSRISEMCCNLGFKLTA